MIRSLTIIEKKDEIEPSKIAYQLSGDLPLDAAAAALVIIAFNTSKQEQKQDEKKE